MAFIITQTIAIPIGIFSALRQDTWGDYFARSFAIMCYRCSGFWLATLVVVYPAIWWGYSPQLLFIHFSHDPAGNLRSSSSRPSFWA